MMREIPSARASREKAHGIRINKKVAALTVARNLRASQQVVQQDNERLSLALRIYRAAGDPPAS